MSLKKAVREREEVRGAVGALGERLASSPVASFSQSRKLISDTG